MPIPSSRRLSPGAVVRPVATVASVAGAVPRPSPGHPPRFRPAPPPPSCVPRRASIAPTLGAFRAAAGPLVRPQTPRCTRHVRCGAACESHSRVRRWDWTLDRCRTRGASHVQKRGGAARRGAGRLLPVVRPRPPALEARELLLWLPTMPETAFEAPQAQAQCRQEPSTHCKHRVALAEPSMAVCD